MNPAEMLFELEKLTADAAPDFVNGVAEDESSVEDGDFGFLEREELAVEVDDHRSRLTDWGGEGIYGGPVDSPVAQCVRSVLTVGRENQKGSRTIGLPFCFSNGPRSTI
jgi:hypothetical protein